jgi:hypothetical protein
VLWKTIDSPILWGFLQSTSGKIDQTSDTVELEESYVLEELVDNTHAFILGLPRVSGNLYILVQRTYTPRHSLAYVDIVLG